MSTIMNGDGNYAGVLLRNFISKSMKFLFSLKSCHEYKMLNTFLCNVTADNHTSVVTHLWLCHMQSYLNVLSSGVQYVAPRQWHACHTWPPDVPWQKVFLSRRLKVTGVFHSPLQSTYRSDVIFLSKFTQTYNGLNDLVILLSE